MTSKQFTFALFLEFAILTIPIQPGRRLLSQPLHFGQP